MSKKKAPSKVAAKEVAGESYDNKVEYAKQLIRERAAAQRIINECNKQLEKIDHEDSWIGPDGCLYEA